DALWEAFFIKSDTALREQDGGTALAFLKREPSLILSFGRRAVEHAGHGERAVFEEIVETGSKQFGEGGALSREFSRLKESFDIARAEYLMAYHLHLGKMKNIETRKAVGLAGLHRAGIK